MGTNLTGNESLKIKVKKKLGTNFLNSVKLDRSEIKFIYAISMKKEGSLSDNLPFFSKISLRQNIKDLRRLNFDLNIIKISMEEKT